MSAFAKVVFLNTGSLHVFEPSGDDMEAQCDAAEDAEDVADIFTDELSGSGECIIEANTLEKSIYLIFEGEAARDENGDTMIFTLAPKDVARFIRQLKAAQKEVRAMRDADVPNPEDW